MIRRFNLKGMTGVSLNVHQEHPHGTSMAEMTAFVCRMLQRGPHGSCCPRSGGPARPGLPHQLLPPVVGPTHDRHLQATAAGLTAVANSSADFWRLFGMRGCGRVGVLIQVPRYAQECLEGPHCKDGSLRGHEQHPAKCHAGCHLRMHSRWSIGKVSSRHFVLVYCHGFAMICRSL